MWWALLLEYIFIAVFVVLVMRHLKARNIPYHVLISVWVSWTSALSLVALVPIDLNLAYLKRCISHYDGDLDSQAELCPSGYWLTWSMVVTHVSQESIDAALLMSETALRYCWLWVFSVCQVNGWILLTFQQSFVEAQHFKTKERMWQAAKENGGFYVVCGLIGVAFILVLYLLGRDLGFWIGAMLAVANAICLVIVAMMLGYGLAEAPKAIFQRARAKPTLRRALYNVYQFHHDYNASADALATVMAEVYLLRKAAGNTLRALSKEIMVVMGDCPFDLTEAVLMHPTKGPSIPMTREEMKTAFTTRLSEIEADKVFDYQMTEVDQWIFSLENAQLIPRGADVFGIQEALLEAGHKMLSDLDAIDPGHRGDGVDRKVRERGLQTAIDEMKVPGTALVHRALIAAIIKRNDEAFAPHDFDDDADISTGEHLEKPEEWDVKRLIDTRKTLYLAKKRYRRSKKKFDHASRRAVFLQDIKSTRMEYESVGKMVKCLWRGMRYGDKSEQTGFKGLVCPVRKQWSGSYGTQLEAFDFFWMSVVTPYAMMLSSFFCAVAALMVLWTELSVFPLISHAFEDSQKGSLLLYHVCTGAATPPGCFTDFDPPAVNIPPQPWVVAWEVRTWVQWIIIIHIFFICSILYFSLLRLRVFSIYEVVVGETDAFSLLFNAYVVCRLAPSIAQNYLNLLQEAHEIPQEEGTVFEKVFSAMGKIPFVDLTFNDVIPPVVLISFLVTIINALTRKCVECPRLDGEAHKTDGMIDEAEEIARAERRKHENRCKLEGSVKRTKELQDKEQALQAKRNEELMAKQKEVEKHATQAWGKVKGAVAVVEMRQMQLQNKLNSSLQGSPFGLGQSPSSTSLADSSTKEGDRVAMLRDIELGGDEFTDTPEKAGNGSSGIKGPATYPPTGQEGGARPELQGTKPGGPKWAKKISNPRAWAPSPSSNAPTTGAMAVSNTPPAVNGTRTKWQQQGADLLADLDNI